MAYVNEGISQRSEVLMGGAVDSVVFWPKIDGANVTPSAAFATVCDQNGSAKVPRTAVTPGTGGKLVVSQTWPTATYPIGEDYFILWEWTADTVPYVDRQYFDVVRNKLICSVAEHDLTSVYPNLLAHIKAIKAPTETESEVLTRFIRQAWSELLDRIRSSGSRPSLILDKARLHNPAVRLSLALVCDALSRDPGDLWAGRTKTHMDAFEVYFGGLGTLKYDLDEDALVSTGETIEPAIRNFSV